MGEEGRKEWPARARPLDAVYPMGYIRPVAYDIEKTDEFVQWIDALRDRQGRAKVLVRIERMRTGNFGSVRNLTGTVSEMKIDFGPGYRVYYTLRRKTVVILLVGGDKSTQQTDIRLAIELAKGF